jgi:hypothetical protein
MRCIERELQLVIVMNHTQLNEKAAIKHLRGCHADVMQILRKHLGNVGVPIDLENNKIMCLEMEII